MDACILFIRALEQAMDEMIDRRGRKFTDWRNDMADVLLQAWLILLVGAICDHRDQFDITNYMKVSSRKKGIIINEKPVSSLFRLADNFDPLLNWSKKFSNDVAIVGGLDNCE